MRAIFSKEQGTEHPLAEDRAAPAGCPWDTRWDKRGSTSQIFFRDCLLLNIGCSEKEFQKGSFRWYIAAS